MAKLKVVVPLLNNRTLPVTDTTDKSNVTGKVKKDFQFESIAQERNALGDWFKDRDGNWYWGGGLEEMAFINFPPVKINWKNNFIGLTDELKAHTGKSVKVAIIDMGVDISHPGISGNIELPKDFTQNAGPMTDEEGHGTAIAGIICAKTDDEKGIIGIAPDCRIIPIKVMKDGFDRVSLQKNIIDAIQYAIDEKADILNISQDFFGIDTTAVENLVKVAAQQGMILIASAGDKNELTDSGVTYPGSDPNFISIGASNKLFTQSIINKHPNRLDFLGGFKMFWTLSSKPDKYITLQGSSFCAAFISGVCALIISKLKAENKNVGQSPRVDFIGHLSKMVSTEDDLYKENFFSFIKI